MSHHMAIGTYLDSEEIEGVMRTQFEVWEGYDEVKEALIDTCGALAQALSLTPPPSLEWRLFMERCGAWEKED